MELHQLRYFAAVAELENFTRAAEHCHVSQPSLSQQIIKLEQQLGRPLFERLGRKVRLTDAGRSLYEHAVRILASIHDAESCLDTTSDWKESTLSVGAILTVAPYFLPGVLGQFRKQFPKSRVTVHEGFTAELVRACLTGDIDVAVVALPIQDERLEVEPLFTEELLLAMPAEKMPWSVRRPRIDDLNRMPFVLLDEMHCLGGQIVRFCQQRECLPAITCKTAQLLTVQHMVGLGQGVSLVPELAAREDKTGSCRYVSLGDEAPRRTIAMIRHKDRFRSELVNRFQGWLRKSLP